MTREQAWLEELADCYLRPSEYAEITLDDEEDNIGFSVEERYGALLSQMWRLEREEPEDCWRLIVALCDRPLSDAQVALLGAGLFEDFMERHGIEFIDRVESAARGDANIRGLVDAMWTNHPMDQSVIRALKAIKSSPKPQKTSSR